MTNNAGANAPKAPLRNFTFSAELVSKSAPQLEAIGSDVISQYISTPSMYFRNKGTEVEGHSTEMVLFQEFEGASTTKIGRALGLKDTERGSCVPLYIIVSRKLLPITTLTGNEFLAAWWQTVMSHRTLWKKGVRHCDISPSNLMGYRLSGRFISVFNDFDLSSTKRDGPRTGTVPFMSLHLLIPGTIAGEIEHMYQHDAESFIWVLTWICLRYEGGKLLSKGKSLEKWLTVGAMRCHEQKTGFLARLRWIRPTRSHEGNFNVAIHCLAVTHEYTGPFACVPTDDEEVFLIWLQNHIPALVRERNISSGQLGTQPDISSFKRRCYRSLQHQP